jgi:hypothetical protein
VALWFELHRFSKSLQRFAKMQLKYSVEHRGQDKSHLMGNMGYYRNQIKEEKAGEFCKG